LGVKIPQSDKKMEEKSVFDRIKNEDDRMSLLQELEYELMEENCSLEAYRNDPLLRFHDNEATLQAEFYHFCKIRKIPCYLEVCTVNGKHDAIIIYPKKIIVEFKMVKNISEIQKIPDIPQNANQLNNYLDGKIPVLIITNKCDIFRLMSKLRSSRLENNLYHYNQQDDDFFIIKHKKIKRFKQT